MPTSESGHAPNRIYRDQDGNLHLNGASIYTDESGTTLSGTEVAYLDGLTAGTAAASKALVTDSSTQIGSIAALAIGTTVPTNPQALLAVLPQAKTATANQSYFHEQILTTGGAVTIPTGTAPVVASLNVHEPNITATGTVTAAATVRIVDAPTEGSSNYALWVDSGVTRLDGNLQFSAALDVVSPANTAAAVEITDGTTSLYAVDTRNTVTVQNHLFAQPASQTLPDGATSRFRLVSVAAPTVTLAGTTQVTTTNQGASLWVGGPTYNQSGGAVTVDQVSTMHVAAVTAGASVTITNKYMISTGVSDCFLTNAGVWTDTASVAVGKNEISDAADFQIGEVIDQIRPRTWKYKPEFHGHDNDRQRYGIVAEELPEAFSVPGNYKGGLSAGVLSSFNTAAIKYLKDRLDALEAKHGAN